MICTRCSATVLEYMLDRTHPEFLRVCDALGTSQIDLDTIFVTFLRRDLTEEECHAKITDGKRELAEFTEPPRLPFPD